MDACKQVAYDGSLKLLLLTEDLFSDCVVRFSISLDIVRRPLLIVDVL